MKIKEIELNNFRIYKGTNVIDLLPDNDKNMIIISGKNGYGKTTFLMSLVWCLYGRLMQQVDKLYADEISSQGNYEAYISNSINRLAKSEGENKFFVSVSFIDVDLPIEMPTKELKIIRSYDTLTRKEEVEILINSVKSEITREYGYEKFITDFILPREIAKFFFFDAEKIISLATIHTSEQKKELSKAYSEVLGIKKYEDLKNKLKELLNNLKKESATTEERIKLNELKQQIENNKLILEKNSNEIEELTEEINLLAYQIDQIQSKLVHFGHTISDSEFEEMKTVRINAENKIRTLKDDLSKLYEYVPFGIAGNKVMEVAKQLHLEKEYKEKKFNIDNIEQKTEKIINKLNDLREKETSKTGQEFVIPVKTQEFYNSTIRELIKEHLYDSKDNLPIGFEPLLQFSENEKRDLDNLINHLRLSFKEQLKMISNDYVNSTYQLTVLERQIKEAESNLQDEHIKELRQQKKELSEKRDLLIEKVGSLKKEIERLEGENVRILKESNKLSEKIKISDNQKEKGEIYKTLINQLNTFTMNFQNEKKVSLEKSILKNLKSLLHMDLIDNVRVDITNDYVDILLFNKRKEEISKDSISKGQQQIYASSLLKSLVEESEISFPVFIDSPMQKFDETHSENIIRNFYPNVSEQVVIFPLLNKELTFKEFQLLQPAISKSYLIENINPDKSEFKRVEINELMK